MKQCCTCKNSKPLTDFGKNKSTKDGLNKRCKTCHNSSSSRYYELNTSKHRALVNANNVRLYWPDLSKDEALKQYETLVLSQNNQCAICKIDLSQFEKRPHIDHNHKTGQVRGLLCSNCNRGLGYLKDSMDVLQSAIEYLKNSP